MSLLKRWRYNITKNAKPLIELDVDDEVIIDPYGGYSRWQPGKIVGKMPFRKYQISMGNGRTLTRNWRHVHPRKYNVTEECRRYDFEINDDPSNDANDDEQGEQRQEEPTKSQKSWSIW